jgi:hypothetical protein
MWRPLTALLQLAVASDGSLTANRMEPVLRQAAAQWPRRHCCAHRCHQLRHLD